MSEPDVLRSVCAWLATDYYAVCNEMETQDDRETEMHNRCGSARALAGDCLDLLAEREQLRASLAAVVKAWASEANMGDGICEENGPVLDAARELLKRPE